MAETELPVRLAGRVIVLDPGDRVLLFRYDDPLPNAGAQRELAEETGWDDVPVRTGPVFDRWITMLYGDRIVRQREVFFLARVSVDRRALGEVAAMHVSDGIAETRWWTLAELDSTGETVWPEGLPDLVRSLRS